MKIEYLEIYLKRKYDSADIYLNDLKHDFIRVLQKSDRYCFFACIVFAGSLSGHCREALNSSLVSLVRYLLLFSFLQISSVAG
jgi:hypothetical protein